MALPQNGFAATPGHQTRRIFFPKRYSPECRPLMQRSRSGRKMFLRRVSAETSRKATGDDAECRKFIARKTWQARAAAFIKVEVAKAEITYEELAKRMKKHGLGETKASVTNKRTFRLLVSCRSSGSGASRRNFGGCLTGGGFAYQKCRCMCGGPYLGSSAALRLALACLLRRTMNHAQTTTPAAIIAIPARPIKKIIPFRS